MTDNFCLEEYNRKPRVIVRNKPPVSGIFKILITIHLATVAKPFGRADPVQAEKLKSLKLIAGLIHFSRFTDRVVPLKVI